MVTKEEASQKPKFRDLNELSYEQLTDPDYALKQLVKRSGGKISITCSKCHHCRRQHLLLINMPNMFPEFHKRISVQ